MNEQELRALVRQTIARHLPAAGERRTSAADRAGALVQAPAVPMVPAAVPFGSHASHAIYMQLVNDGGACVIEPSVSCDHCGYCKSHGH